MAKGAAQVLTGMVELTPRAFQMDAEQAMGTDPTRAIVELVTNADDAYVKKNAMGRGSIRIEVERRRRNVPNVIVVRDRAGGMTRAEMVERLARLGARTSGFEVQVDVRGLLGRGAKDCATFGPVRWESTTEVETSVLDLDRSGGYRAEIVGAGARPRDCGTTVTLTVDPTFTLRNHQGLKEALLRHYELRPILSDPERREVTLVDRNQERQDRLICQPPLGALVEEKELEVPGFPGERILVKLWRATENLDDGWGREYWRHGLLITSGRAAYDVFAGKFEREPWGQYLGWFFGQAEIPGIRELIREYDDTIERELPRSEANPIRLIRRDRAGLVRPAEHPFVRAITTALEQFLQPHIEALRAELEAAATKVGLTEETQRRLRQLGSVVGKFFEEEEQAISTGSGTGAPAGLVIIPGAQEVEPGRAAKFSVQFRPEEMAVPPTGITATARVVDGVGRVDPAELSLIDRGGYFSRSFSVEDPAEGELVEVLVELNGFSATCLTECRQPDPPPQITRLQFEHATYRVRDAGRRHLLLLAPWSLIADEAVDVKISLVGDPSISRVQGPSSFGYDEVRKCAVARVTIQGRGVGSRARVSAVVASETAVAEIHVAVQGAGGVDVRFADEAFHQRAIWAGNTLKISARDSSISRYLGQASKDWPGQNSLHFRTMLAEIVAFHSVRRVLEAKYSAAKQLAPGLYREHLQLEQRCLARIHKVLVPNDELP